MHNRPSVEGDMLAYEHESGYGYMSALVAQRLELSAHNG